MTEDNIHVLPVNDFREHVESSDCWCKPDEDDGVITHHSLDGRDKYETGERKLN